jgi:tetratricopeptide (TPR) repeat protein
MAATTTSYSVLSLEEAARSADPGPYAILNPDDPDAGERRRVRLRSELGIGSFGTSAVWQGKAGGRIVIEHDELGPGATGQEELYVVVAGGATFTVDGEEVAAPHGTAVFVRDPASKRSATATEDGTIILSIGGRPGEAFRPGPGESILEFYRLYAVEDMEGALAVCREALEEHPGNAMILYNLACSESRLGKTEDALAHLGESLAAWPDYKELASGDTDLDPLRDDARFQALVA